MEGRRLVLLITMLIMLRRRCVTHNTAIKEVLGSHTFLVNSQVLEVNNIARSIRHMGHSIINMVGNINTVPTINRECITNRNIIKITLNILKVITLKLRRRAIRRF